MKRYTLKAHTYKAVTSATALLAAACLTVPAVAEPPAAEMESPSDIMPPAFALPDEPLPESRQSPSEGGAAGPARPQAEMGADGARQPGVAPGSPAEREKVLADLYARLATAPDAETAAPIADALERVWSNSGSPTADLLVQRATALAQQNRQDLALKLLTTAVELQPDHVEAWSRRAYLFYLMNDTKRALGDLRRVLALEPNHFKALEGLASILQNAGEKSAALKAYESLLKVHPQMPGAKEARDELRRAVEGQGI